MDVTLIDNLNHFPVPIGFCINWLHSTKDIQVKTYALQCPTCNKAFCLAQHAVDLNGNVTPSVVCPFNCGFHVMMKIVWNK
jgi:DNA-directed RNA polymerase subunit RPC12/RpoP